MAKWKITDNSTGTPVVWTFPINPNAFTHPGRAASLTQERTVANTGNTIIFQGADAATQLSFSGIVNSETFYNELRTQLNKWYVLGLTDDQNASWNIVVKSYSMTRVRKALNHYRFDYEVTAIVVV